MSSLRLRLASFTFVSLAVTLAACGPDSGSGDDTTGDCTDDTTQCMGNTFQRCVDGAWTVEEQCSVQCDADLGCILCNPDQAFCDGDNAAVCSSDGSSSSITETCTGGEHCFSGACVDLCAEAAENESYI